MLRRIFAQRRLLIGRSFPDKRSEGRGRAFLLDEKGRIDRPVASSRVTIRPSGAWSSSHSCRELVQHHAQQWPAVALAPVGALARRLRRDPRPLQMQLEPSVATAEAMALHKIVLLQQWHALSDPGAEEAVRDRRRRTTPRSGASSLLLGRENNATLQTRHRR
jgi:hypothetical protein